VRSVTAFTVSHIPEVQEGDDLGALIVTVLRADSQVLRPHDIVVIAQKVVSKAEGRVRHLHEFEPSVQALELAAVSGKDARKIEAILSESTEVLRAVKVGHEGLIIACHKQGWICANAAIDESNVGPGQPDGALLLLPEDPDRSAVSIRSTIEQSFEGPIGVLVTDTFGRPWRQGLVNVAIGTAGVPMIDNWIGRADAYGRKLHATQPALADEIAAMGGMLMSKDQGTPVVVVRGLDWQVTPGASARDVLRPYQQELFK
jgi:coenzyme F420-0:L-glutamate ligase